MKNFPLTIIVVVFFFSHVAGEDTKDIKLLPSGPYNLQMNNPQPYIRIPIGVPDLFVKGEYVIHQLDMKPETASFNVSIVQGTNSKAYFIELVPRDGARLRPATYNLILIFEKTSPPVFKQAPLNVSIVVKPAMLAIPPVVYVQRVRSFPWSKDYTTNNSSFLISESTGESYIGPFIIHQIDKLIDPKTNPAPGTVNFSNQNKGIAVGTDAEITYSFKDDLPFGKSTGNFEVISPRLTAPASFRMEIMTRLNKFWLVLIIVAGLISGLIFRTYLTTKILLDDALLKAFDLLSIADKEKKLRPDQGFQNGVKAKVIDPLEKAIAKKVTTDIVTATTDATSALSTEISSFNNRQADVLKNIDSLESTLEVRWVLPDVFRNIIKDAATGLEQARKDIAGNPAVAAKIFKKSFDDFSIAINDATTNYRKQSLQDLNLIDRSLFKTPDITAAVAALKQQVTVIPVDAPATEPVIYLQAVQDANFKSGELAFSLAEKLDFVAKNVMADLQSVINLPNTQSLQTLINTGNNLDASLSKTNSSSDRLHQLSISLLPAQTAIANAISTQLNVTAADPAIQQQNLDLVNEITNDLTNGSYEDAARQTVVLLRNNGFTIQPFPAAAARQFKSAGAGPTIFPAPGTAVVRTLMVPAGDNGINANTKRISRDLFAAKTWQDVFSGIGITAVGYIIFADGFVGTGSDFGGAFFWAFALNISIAGLTGITGKVVKA